MEEKRREKYLLTRYKRELERYLNRIVNFVQKETFKTDEFDAFVKSANEKLSHVQKVPLYNDYFEKLEQFIEKTNRLCESGSESDEIRALLLHEANQIRKSKRKKSYSRKERHRSRDDDF
ncbi:hypothetical protein [Hydrogenimonas urashimensis]|uniref:hypothetical protein n=1 Tax=Hydrogenimonas urashimensis TaxID=2740515 RepID=UPI0019169DA9|nr:hypothetical protein [Hydrogenimonas urashimensis]